MMNYVMELLFCVVAVYFGLYLFELKFGGRWIHYEVAGRVEKG